MDDDAQIRRRVNLGPLPSKAKQNRLTLRMHPDVLKVLSYRAKEQGISRSALVERMLVGMMNADPRNPKMDPVGRIYPGRPHPLRELEEYPHRMAERWHKYVFAHEVIMGAPPNRDFYDDPDRWWDAEKQKALEETKLSDIAQDETEDEVMSAGPGPR